MVWEIISWTIELTFNIVCFLIQALVWIFQQTFYLVFSWILPTLGLIVEQSFTLMSSWMLPALGWVLEQIINLVWNYPFAVIGSILGALLAIVAFPFTLVAMGFTSAGILVNSFGAWMMSVVYYYGWGLPLLSFFQSAGALGTISGWIVAAGGMIGFGISYVSSLICSMIYGS